ncbi:MAG: mechanosensitive ion channel family protein [Firmicutes bacterium]|nr:mechanosensitive ion channel family protein [Bacillota bacterium]
MAELFQSIQDYFQSVDLTALLIVCGLVVLIFIIKQPLVSLILKLAFTSLRRKAPARYEELKEKLAKPLGYVLFLSLLLIALPYVSLQDVTYNLIQKILTTILLLVSYLTLYRALMIAVNWRFQTQARRKPDKINLSARNFLISGIRVVLIILAAISVLTPWVGSLSGLIAGLGISSLAVALAAQDSLSNFFGSISLMLDKPFDVGDFITLPDNQMGTVEHVGLRSTRIRQLSGSLVSIPNAKLALDVIDNETKRTQRRIHFTVGLEYRTPDDQLTAFIKAVEALLLHDPDVLDDSIKVWFDAFADSSLTVGVIYRVNIADYFQMLTVKERINYGVLLAAKQTGVSMAFPSVSVYNANPNP